MRGGRWQYGGRAVSNLESLVQRFLTHRRPGWLMPLVARAPLPVLRADAFAARRPDPGASAPEASPIIEAIAPRAAPVTGARLLDGDVVIKDQLDVAACRTGVGRAEPGDVAAADAPVVARIVAAGGRIVGKAKMTELGIDGLGTVMHYAMPPNPRAPGYSPGGSSTGTAVAVATGLARYGVGGDGLGSVRIPAAFCGLVGLKPSRTRLPREGTHSPVRSLDAVGPIARDVADCARLWQVMAAEPIADVAPWVPARIGVPWRHLGAARDVVRAFDRMLAALAARGAAEVRVALPGLEHATFLGGLIGAYELSTGPFAGAVRTRAGHTSRALGGAMTERHAARLYAQRDALRDATARALDRTPVLAFPTTAIPPPAITHRLVRGGAELLLLRALGAYTPLANLTDLPAIAVPCGVDDRGRPLSIMFVGGPGAEGSLLALAAAVEQTGLGARPLDRT